MNTRQIKPLTPAPFAVKSIAGVLYRHSVFRRSLPLGRPLPAPDARHIRMLLPGIVLFTALILLLLASIAPVLAQSGASASLSQPDTQAFPYIEAYLDVRDAQNRFVSGLEPSQVRVIEDGRVIRPTRLEELYSGLQLVVALNPDQTFGVRNSRGATRAEIILSALDAWANSRRGSTVDDWSLLTGASETVHLSRPSAWLDQLRRVSEAFSVDNLQQAAPSLDTLSHAIDIAGDATPRPGMGRAVLYITPAFEQQPAENVAAVSYENIIARAKEQGVKVYIWMIPSPGASSSTAENTFNEKSAQEIANQTGGQLFIYKDGDPLPDPENFLSSMRKAYRLGYESLVRTSGSHQIAVDIQDEAFAETTSTGGTGSVTTPVMDFEIEILPPEPAFISPPLLVQRLPPLDEEGKASPDAPVSEYLPTEQALKIIVGFPDERVRPIVRTSLFVDGILTAENRQPPYDEFLWDLQEYTTSGSHLLRVEAEDSLGLVGSSIEQLIQVNSEIPARSPWAWIYNNVPALTILGIVIAGAVLLLVLVLGGRIRPRVPGIVGPRGASGRQKSRRKSDPVTQPVVIQTDAKAKRSTGWADRIHWPQRHIAPKADAFLSRIAEVRVTDSILDRPGEIQSSSTNSASTTPIAITSDEITIGSKPELATLVINDSSVESLHARIVRTAEGNYRITDEGSIAGTWINYTPISHEGAALEHGDLIHVGRVGFRFTLRQPGQMRKPVVMIDEGYTIQSSSAEITNPTSSAKTREEPKA